MFYKMMCNGMTESKQIEIELPNFRADIPKVVLDSIYYKTSHFCRQEMVCNYLNVQWTISWMAGNRSW